MFKTYILYQDSMEWSVQDLSYLVFFLSFCEEKVKYTTIEDRKLRYSPNRVGPTVLNTGR